MSDGGARLAQLSAEERALLFEKLRRRKDQGGAAPGAERPQVPRRPQSLQNAAPLSFAQQRLWFLDRLRPGEPTYHIPMTVVIRGAMDPGALHRALQAIVDRHESLRTTFRVVDGAPVQLVARHLEVPLPLIDAAGVGAAGDPEVMRACEELAWLPFDLAAGPLLRAALFRLEPRRHVLTLTLHHIVTDGWSMGVLVADLAAFAQALLRGEDLEAALPPLPVQYADYAVWQRDQLSGERLEALTAVWRRRLGDLTEPLSLPADRPRPPVKDSAGSMLPVRLDRETDASLQAAAREEGVTSFMFLLAVWQILLARWSGQELFAVGSVVAGRLRPELERLIGFFVNTLALRADVRGTPTVRELLARVREVTLEAFAHQEIPFEKLVEELRPERDPSRTPIFQAVLSLQNTPRPRADLGEVSLTGVELPVHHVKFDLEIGFEHGENGVLQGMIIYSTALFDAATVERLIGHLRTLLAAASADRDCRIGELPLLTQGEVRQLEAWSRTGAQEQRLVAPEDLFADLAAAAPDAPAVVWDAGTLTRGELDAAANRLARRLRGLGVGPEVPVGVLLPRSPELVLAALAVARSGGAYLPIDPVYPGERVATILADAGAPVVLTRGDLADRLAAEGRTVLLLDAVDWPGLALRRSFVCAPAALPVACSGQAEPVPGIQEEDAVGEDAAPLTGWTDPDQLAYIIYTSGSTGRPKGVGLRRWGLANLVAWSLRNLPGEPGGRATLMAGPAFDGSIWELWFFLSLGAALHLPGEETRLAPRRLAAWLREQRIDCTFLPTPLAEALLAEALLTETGAAELPLRFLATGGDRLHRIGRSGLPLPFQVANCYGPSEATVMTTCAPDIAGEPGDRDPSVGWPIAGVEVRVLDAALHPVPAGVPGEMWIGGEVLGRGYLGRPDLTAAVFRPDPFARTAGARLYRTGDLARWRPDGRLEVLGRLEGQVLDGQVKLRGFRVETGEVEAALGSHPAVHQAVVLPRDGANGRILVAYLVAEQAGDDELRGHLRRLLPEFMVPALFVRLPALPLTPGGKVDRGALAAMALPAAPSGPGTAPRSATERKLAAIWAEVLEREPPGVGESFFDLGGHSLLLARLQTRIGEELGREVPLLKLIEHPTIAAFAAWLEKGMEGEREVPPASGESRERAERQRQALELQRQRLIRRPPNR